MRRIVYTVIFFAVLISLPAAASVTFNQPSEQEATQHIRLGIFHADRGELDKAIAEFEKAVRLNPAAYEAYYNMGLAYMKKGDYKKAAENFERVYRNRPDTPGLDYNYGVSLMKLKRYKEALPKLERALKSKPGDSDLKALVEKAKRLSGN